VPIYDYQTYAFDKFKIIGNIVCKTGGIEGGTGGPTAVEKNSVSST
jgi:hypothetical protein